jgi:hypothetical protein
MPLLRYVIALVVRAVVGIAGLALFAYGAVYVGGSLFMLTQMWGGLSQTGDTPPISFLVQHFGLYGGIAAVGIFLMVVAIRGAIARIRAGLPTEDEGVGASPLSRMMNVVIYGAGFLFGAVTVAINIVPGTEMAMFVARGVTVEAKILGFDKTDEPGVWNARYTFTTKDGQTITDSVKTERSQSVPSTQWLKTLDLVYLESDPSQHKPLLGYSHSSFVFFIVTRLLIALVGLWGLLKNVSPTPKVPESDRPDLGARATSTSKFAPSAPTPAPLHRSGPSAASRRATFGRRGA